MSLEDIRTKLLVAQIFSILSLAAWLALFLYFMYMLTIATTLIGLTPFGGAFTGYLMSTAITYAVGFLILLTASAIVTKRIHEMYNAANQGNIDRLKQLNSVAWSIIALIFSGIVPGVMLLLAQGPIEGFYDYQVIEPLRPSSPNPVDALMRLKSLLDSGAITESEFVVRKERLLYAEPRKADAVGKPTELLQENRRNLNAPVDSSSQKEGARPAIPRDDPAMINDLKRRLISEPLYVNTIHSNEENAPAAEIPWEHFERLWKLKSLLDSDVITKDEFIAQKARLLQGKAGDSSLEESVRPPIRESALVLCTTCGRPLAVGVRFCGSCGTPINRVTSSDVPKVAAPTRRVDVSRVKGDTGGWTYPLIAFSLFILGLSTFGLVGAMKAYETGQNAQFAVYGQISLVGAVFAIYTINRTCRRLVHTQPNSVVTTNLPQIVVTAPLVKVSHRNRNVAVCVIGLLLILFLGGAVLTSRSISPPSSPQTQRDQIIMEAYQWQTTPTLTLILRNTGSTTANLAAANFYLDGIQQPTFTIRTCSPSGAPAFKPGVTCTVTLSIATGSYSSGVAYALKLVLPDGGVMSYSVIDGVSA